MQVNTDTLRQVREGVRVDWNPFRWCRRRRCDQERMAEVGLFVSTLALLGYVAWWATKALEAYRVWGLG